MNNFIQTMTVLGRGLIFQPVLASLSYSQAYRERGGGERERERERGGFVIAQKTKITYSRMR